MTITIKMIENQIREIFPSKDPRTDILCEHLIKLCEDFIASGLSDSNFLTGIASQSKAEFWQRISEPLVFHCLRDKKFGARKIGHGPDFLVMDGDRKVWIEVICPKPIDVPKDYLNQKSGAIWTPHEAILLRWTAAIKEKYEKLLGTQGKEGWLKSGLVAPEDAYVIAVNGCQLRNGAFPAIYGISRFPYAAEAVFPIGPEQITIDKESKEVVNRGHQYRSCILNKNCAEIPLYMFMNPNFNSISAIWAVHMDGGSAIGNSEPKVVVHNPNATNKIPLGFLPADEEYIAIPQGNDLILTSAIA